MDAKKVIEIIAIVLLLAAIIYVFIPKGQGDWIEEIDGNAVVNVEAVTEGLGFVDVIGQQYRDGEIETVFDYEGYYKGEFFKREFTDSNGLIQMKINNSMKPGDNIVEGFMVEKLVEGKPIVYIFVDSDWREEMPVTNIIWGSAYENERKFKFSNEISEGIFMDSIEDDPSRFSEDYNIHFAGVLVGDMTRENTDRKTLIKLT